MNCIAAAVISSGKLEAPKTFTKSKESGSTA